MTTTDHEREPEGTEPAESGGLAPEKRLWRLVVGRPRSLSDTSLFHRLSLIPFLAWVGLGADGLSSSAYGPEEAFKALGDHAYLAVWLAVLTAITVFIISLAYSKVIELFPAGGGGYLVATKLLGSKLGIEDAQRRSPVWQSMTTTAPDSGPSRRAA